MSELRHTTLSRLAQRKSIWS